ncbi:hypothetical protein [Legionella sp. W10-070]|uniref:hypothetical protein n=1 Tax=Legionella sp. W10-070 TaxID=1117709 RepID=UPI00105666B9|nr:hypothetical protein [Legionella sp. W10-070]
MINNRDISKMLEETAKEINERVQKSVEEINSRVQKASEEVNERVQKSVEEINSRVQKASEEVNERVQKSVEEINSRVLNASEMSQPKVKTASERLDEINKNINQLKKAEQKIYKPLFLKAILTKNYNLFKEVMTHLNLEEEPRDASLFLFNNKDPGAILLDPVLIVLQTALASEEEKALLSILMSTFQSIPELSRDESGISLGMRDKKTILMALLDQVEEPKKASICSQLTDLSFDAQLPAFRPSIGDKNYVKTSINMKNYLSAIGSDTDVSEFIVLTIGLLQSQRDIDKTFLQKLSADYLFVDYESCMKNIHSYFISQIKENAYSDMKLEIANKTYQKIVESMDKLKPFDPQKNDTRRFFETRLAQYINGLTHSQDSLPAAGKARLELYDDEALRKDTLEAANKILYFFLGEEGVVASPREMEQKISIFANGYKDTSKFSKDEIEFIASVMKRCEVYKGRDRIARESILERKFEIRPENVGGDAWNSAGGVMKGTSPVFFDAQRQPMRNMLVDSSTVAAKDIKKQQWFWSNNREYAAYVGSISGHTCNIVGMLNKYMENNNEDPNLSRDITLFLTQLVAVYAKRGYHGMLEVLDVLHDPGVQEIFSHHGVTLNLCEYFGKNPEVAAFFDYAMNDASMYAQVMISKHQLGTALSKSSFFSEKPKASSEKVEAVENHDANDEYRH